MHYIHNLHSTLAEVRIGEKVLLAYRPDPSVMIRVRNGVVASVNATLVRIAWEGNDPPPLDTFTEDGFPILSAYFFALDAKTRYIKALQACLMTDHIRQAREQLSFTRS